MGITALPVLLHHNHLMQASRGEIWIAGLPCYSGCYVRTECCDWEPFCAASWVGLTCLLEKQARRAEKPVESGPSCTAGAGLAAADLKAKMLGFLWAAQWSRKQRCMKNLLGCRTSQRGALCAKPETPGRARVQDREFQCPRDWNSTPGLWLWICRPDPHTSCVAMRWLGIGYGPRYSFA